MNYLAYEVNFDCIPGPTHNYGGLSVGNIASMEHKGEESNPKEAALQALEKMKFLTTLGIKQAVLPPHDRPHQATLKALGFTGNEQVILKTVKEEAPWILNNVSSAASMWAANWATVSPSIDSVDSHVHFTPANMASKFHRAIEHRTTSNILKAIFRNPVFFEHHDALLPINTFWDEGAANHMRFCKDYNGPGIQVFVSGTSMNVPASMHPKKFPARQTLEASQAVARMHQMFPQRVLYAYQHPDAIDAGVFHNDVVAMSNRNYLIVHQKAFQDQNRFLTTLKERVAQYCDTELTILEVDAEKITLETAVKTFLFNSQLVSIADGSMTLLAPMECKNDPRVDEFLRDLADRSDTPIGSIHYFNLKQSMQNGGGPACLRLRVVLNEVELNETNPKVFLTDQLYARLVDWVKTNYRDRLSPNDLDDPNLLRESQEALDKLSKILDLGNVYSFQL